LTQYAFPFHTESTNRVANLAYFSPNLVQGFPTFLLVLPCAPLAFRRWACTPTQHFNR